MPLIMNRRYPLRSRVSIASPPQPSGQSGKMEDGIAASPEPQSPEVTEVQFCMVCLNTSENCRLYPATSYYLDMEFEHLTGISLQGMTHFEPQFCAECAQRLSNCAKFRDKSLRAYLLLMESVEEHKTFTKQYVITLGRSNNLTSSMAKKTFPPDHCDLHLKHKGNREKNEKTEKVVGKIGKIDEKTGKGKEKTTDEETPDSKTVSIKIECVNGNLILNPVKVNNDNIQTDDERNGDADDDDDTRGSDTESASESRATNKETNDFEDDDSDTESASESAAANKETRTDDVSENRVVADKPKSGKPQQPIKVKALLKQYKITELTHDEQLKDLENRKVKVSYRCGYHKCMKCFKGFLNVKNYKLHMEKHTDKYGKFVCPVCGLHYRSKKHVGRHVANVHRRRFSCYSCPWVTNEKSAALMHLRCHQKDYFTCPHCLEELRSKTHHLAHLRTVHCTELTCLLCERAFKNERGIRSHINVMHYRQGPVSPLYMCGECHRRFSCEATYRQHLESHKHATDGNPKRKADEMLSSPKDGTNKRPAGEKLKENIVPEKEIIDDEEDDIPTEYLEDFDDFIDIDLESEVNNETDAKNVELTPNTKEYRSRTIDDTTIDPKIVAKGPKKDVDYGYLDQYTVTQLSHEEQCEEIHKRKESANYLNSEFKCVICFKGFTYVSTFNLHMEKHTDKYGDFECPVCFLHFPKRRLLRDHIAYIHSRRYACNSCPLVTNLRNTAVNHAKWHKGITYGCPECPEEFYSKSACWSHIRIFHPTDVVCALCGFSFVNERGLQKHVHMKHRFENVQNPEGPLCEQCDVRFATSAAYQQHLKVSPKHATRRELKRNTPLMQGSKNRGIKKSNDTTTCEQCGLQLPSYRSYFHHFRIHHPHQARTQLPRTALLCEQCGGAFTSSAHLQTHMQTHSGAKPYKCNDCGRTFSTKYNIALHMTTHGYGCATHACPVCGKQFVTKANRDRHVWTHKEQKPFQCEQCDRTFENASSRRTHAQHAHDKRPYPRKSRGAPQRASRRRGAGKLEYFVPVVEMREE